MPIRYCVNCGDAHSGRGDLCPDCVPLGDRPTEALPPAMRSGKSALPPALSRSARCPHCTAELTWHNLRRSERQPVPGHREVVYFCPVCRSVLEFCAWVDLPPRPPSRSETRHR